MFQIFSSEICSLLKLCNSQVTMAPEFNSVFSGVRVARSLVFCVMFCRSFFVLLSFFCWTSCCMSSDLRILITSLVSLNSTWLYCVGHLLYLLFIIAVMHHIAMICVMYYNYVVLS